MIPFLGVTKEENPPSLHEELTSGHAGTLPCASRMDLRFRLARIEAGAASPLLPTAVGGAPLLLLNATALPASCHPPKRT
ncbi:g9483 [Coccomyxa elongata]